MSLRASGLRSLPIRKEGDTRYRTTPDIVAQLPTAPGTSDFSQQIGTLA
jgi:hypothetical protein